MRHYHLRKTTYERFGNQITDEVYTCTSFTDLLKKMAEMADSIGFEPLAHFSEGKTHITYFAKDGENDVCILKYWRTEY